MDAWLRLHLKLAIKAKSILGKEQCAKDIYCLLTSNAIRA